MEIKNFFQKIFSGSREPEVPKAVQQKFAEQFDQSINVEWQKAGDQFEAVFYRDDLEHIATYQSDGVMSCLKINLPLNDLPEMVAETVHKEGELMNAIQIDCNGGLQYELIVRDDELNRYFLLLTESGKVIKKEKL